MAGLAQDQPGEFLGFVFTAVIWIRIGCTMRIRIMGSISKGCLKVKKSYKVNLKI